MDGMPDLADCMSESLECWLHGGELLLLTFVDYVAAASQGDRRRGEHLIAHAARPPLSLSPAHCSWYHLLTGTRKVSLSKTHLDTT